MPQQAPDTTQIPEFKPIPKPRQTKNYFQESNADEDSYEPVQIPVQETCNPAQTLASFLNRTDVVHKDRQQGMVDGQTKPLRWTKPALTGTEHTSSGCSQSTPVSPSLEKDSGRYTQLVKKPG